MTVENFFRKLIWGNENVGVFAVVIVVPLFKYLFIFYL